MRKILFPFFGAIVAALFVISFRLGSPTGTILPEIPEGAEALSLAGEPLFAAEPIPDSLQYLVAARQDYESDPLDPENIIWYGRRAAYAGFYRNAIEIFSEGIKEHPDDARMYRHRGHRYISIREFERAIADLEKAEDLIAGQETRIEPDGQPNSQNTPLTTIQGNIWYHLGLAYYLNQDWENALTSFQNGYNNSSNDDNLVSTGHWIYMILRRMGRPEEAASALVDISRDMTIIENTSYYELCLLYLDEIEFDDSMAANADNPANAAVAYGIANWFYYNGNKSRSDEILDDILTGDSWNSFGYIAAEADKANQSR